MKVVFADAVITTVGLTKGSATISNYDMPPSLIFRMVACTLLSLCHYFHFLNW